MALTNLYKYKGWHGEKTETFTKGKIYDYFPLDSIYNGRVIVPNEGPREVFTDKEFREYFKM